jgi:hypothetical protein
MLDNTRATVRPGCVAVLVNLSAGGALLQLTRPLRPGARVHMQITTPARTMGMAAHVVRCAVSALHPLDGATYRGAVQFEQRCDLLWEGATLSGSSVPVVPSFVPDESGKGLPATKGKLFGPLRRSVK